MALNSAYLKGVYEALEKKSAHEPEFLQAVLEVLESLEPVVACRPELERSGIVERLVEPERTVQFRVSVGGRQRKGAGATGAIRVEFNSAIGPYKGGLRFHPSVNLSIIKFLGFEQIFKNALTDAAHGRRQGRQRTSTPRASPTPRSCVSAKSFMTELSAPHRPRHRRARRRHRRGRPRDRLPVRPVQAHHATRFDAGVLTGKGLTWGGSSRPYRGHRLRPTSTSPPEMLTAKGRPVLRRQARRGVRLRQRGDLRRPRRLPAAGRDRRRRLRLLRLRRGRKRHRRTRCMQGRSRRCKSWTRLQTYAGRCAHCEARVRLPTAPSGTVPCDVALPCATQNELAAVRRPRLWSSQRRASPVVRGRQHALHPRG